MKYKNFIYLLNIIYVYGSPLFISRNHNIYYKNETLFLLKGINYFGFDGYCYAPHGLWIHNLDYYLDFLQQNNFNAIRLPFSYEMVLNFQNKPNIFCITNETSECTSSILTLLQCFFQKTLERNIFVLLDFHRIYNEITECPYGNLQEQDFYKTWDFILQNTVHYPNLLGIDIKNEPHGHTTWMEWGTIVINFIKHINKKFPEFQGLFFVEGVQDDGGWGGSFTNIVSIDFPYNTQIVFSPHVYGVSVRGEIAKYDSENDFHHWFGFLKETYKNAIIIGEIGGYFTNDDYNWHIRIFNYLTKINQTSIFYWCLNPDSYDTNGLLLNDWTSPDYNKLNILNQLQPNPSKIQILD